jgi:hypothetical protein
MEPGSKHANTTSGEESGNPDAIEGRLNIAHITRDLMEDVL